MTQGATSTTSFDCSDVERLLEPYLDGEFGDDDRASLESHRSACASCRDGAAKAMAFRSALRARLRVPVCVLVVTTDEAVARWAATPIVTGQPGPGFVPVVLGPAAVPTVVDDEAAARAPELALLSGAGAR